MPDQEKSTRSNLFRREFLDQVAENPDSPLTLSEAEFAGPWALARHGGFWRVHQPGQRHVAWFRFFETAAMLAAVMPAVGRPPVYSLSPGRREAVIMTPFGERGATGIGETFLQDGEILAPLHTAHCLLISPDSLAWLLMAAPAESLRRAGEIVAARLERARR